MTKKAIIVGSFLDALLWFRQELIKEFINEGYDVIACAPKPENEELIKQVKALNITYIEIPMTRAGLNPFKDISSFLFLYKLFKKEKPTFIISYAIKPVIYGSIAAKLARVPAIFSMITGLGHAFITKGIKGFILRKSASLLYKIALKCNNRVFFQNPDDQCFFVEKGIIPDFKQTQLINGSGVDLEYYKQSPFPTNFSFILVARLLCEKGIYEYAEAARVIKRKYPDITFKLVGFLDKNPSVISAQDLDKWQEEGFIQFLGRSENVRSHLNDSTVFVLPSYREGTPRTVLEAMAVGRPIITTDVPGCRETTTHGLNGLLVKSHDVTSLQLAMEEMFLNSEKIIEMGAQSRRIAEEKYDVHKVNSVICKTINDHI
jgi:glycosyltransferase involved in cell wall biosynthesis